MKITYVNDYNKLGCTFKDNLVVVNYSDYWSELRNSSPIQGFGQGNIFEAKEAAEKKLKELHSDYKILLEIPELVVELS